MALAIVHAEREGIEILTLHGQLTFGPEDFVFRRESTCLLHAGTIRVVLNFTGLRVLDSTGLGTLLFAAEELRKAGGNLVIFNTNQTCADPPREAQLQVTVAVFLTEEDPLSSSFPGDKTLRHSGRCRFLGKWLTTEGHMTIYRQLPSHVRAPDSTPPNELSWCYTCTDTC
jgi:anti-anti-sigma factor